MAYKMYLDGVLMPITPSKVKVKINNQNETLTLISGCLLYTSDAADEL